MKKEARNPRHEKTDPVPVKPPVHRQRQHTVDERIRAAIRSDRMQQIAEARGMESFQEADDFDIEDDPIDPLTPYERDFEGSVTQDMLERAKARVTVPQVQIGEKTFSGKTAMEMVEYLKQAPQAAIDKLLGRAAPSEAKE